MITDEVIEANIKRLDATWVDVLIAARQRQERLKAEALRSLLDGMPLAELPEFIKHASTKAFPQSPSVGEALPVHVLETTVENTKATEAYSSKKAKNGKRR